jgi:GTP cyclohydrolase I/GTP cyclohydrolase-4
MIGGVLARHGHELLDDDFVLARQVNFETIHDHDVLAERWGTVGELKRELETGDRSARTVELRDWLQNGAEQDAPAG